MNSADSPTSTQPISRSERNWLAAAVIFGAILRLCFLNRLAIEHFDEGVYASNFWFGGPYPAQHLYAPPLLPMTIEWTMILASLCGIKPTGFIPMIPPLIAGIATIPSIWWVGRRWFGPTAGMVSAWIVATSDFHACYSRAALTDVPVSLFILWAVYFTWSAFMHLTQTRPETTARGKGKSPSTGWPWPQILLAGTFTGLAWWTKYNGWAAAGDRRRWRNPLATTDTSSAAHQLRKVIGCCVGIGVIAFVIWSPVLWGLQSHEGGYSAVAANHRQYVVGLSGWGRSAITQTQTVGMYDNSLGMLTEPFARIAQHNRQFGRRMSPDAMTLWDLIQVIFSRRRFRNFGPDSMFPLIADIGNLCNYVVTFGLPVLLLVSCVVTIRSCLRNPQLIQSPVAVCLLAAWLGGMTVATPCYHPYPRLVSFPG